MIKLNNTMRNRIKWLFAPFILIIATGFLMRDAGIVDTLRQSLRHYRDLEPEKLYLHTDKPFYSSGEMIWFKVYQVNAVDHRPGGPSGLARVDLLDPDHELVASRFIKLVEGGGAGDILLPDTLASGTYSLQAYTHYMRSFSEDFLFSREVRIWNTVRSASAAPESNISSLEEAGGMAGADSTLVRFFPEGGDLVAGLESRVAVRTENARGQGQALKGEILDAAGDRVALFETNALGLGSFVFRPEAGRAYHGDIGNGMDYALPPSLPQGMVIRIEDLDDGYLGIQVQASDRQILNNTYLIGQSRGQFLFARPYEAQEYEQWQLRVNRDSLPEGITQLTLVDAEGRPFAERLVFVQHPERQPQLRMQATRESFATRRPVTLQLDLLAADGEPEAGQLSMTVTREDLVERDAHRGDIRTWLLLNSDLRGTITDPGYYFMPGHAEELDLLMLTQGWRRFSWQQVLADEWPTRQAVQQGFTVEGKISRLGRDEGVASYVWLNTLGFGQLLEARTLSRSDGRFEVNDLPIEDTTVVVVQARVPRNRRLLLSDMPDSPRGNRDLDIEFIEPEIPLYDPLYLPGPAPATEAGARENYLEESRRVATIADAWGGMSVFLDEVVVTAERTGPRLYDRPGMLYSTPSNRIVPDSMFTGFNAMSPFDFLRTTPGVQVSGAFPNQRAIVRGSSRVLYLLDGMPVDAQVIQSLNPNDIAFIDVLKGPSAAIYGGRGGNGVIAYYTRRGEESMEVPERGPGIDHFTHPGFYHAKRFFQPVYDEEKPEHERPDYRTTLFWEPNIEMKKGDKQLVTIWTSDQAGDYEVLVEGITEKGLPVTGRYLFSVTPQ